MTLYPRTLLWRTFLLLAALMLMSVLAWFMVFRNYEREPRARQFTQMVVSVVNLTRTSLLSARTDARRHLLRELSDREGIHIYPAEPGDRIVPLPDRAFVARVATLIREHLGPETRITLEREGEAAFFVSFRLDDGDGDSSDDDYWLALPIERLDRFVPLQWLGWGLAALLLSLAGAWLIVFRITRPMKALAQAAAEIGSGRRPEAVSEAGPAEVTALAAAFNQMSADLVRLDEDRALILAGISHDLRTPLTRLRMAIELSGVDAIARGEMETDIEEMDKTIGQFLDFARSRDNEGEKPQETDLAALLAGLVEAYQRRGAPVCARIDAASPVTVRPLAIRRAVANLIDNALRYAGSEAPIDLSFEVSRRETVIEVADRGPGIPSDKADHLKLPFTRLDTARSNASGSGLGLAIVDRIARAHGGGLELLPREGGGLIARIRLAGIMPAP